MLLTEDSTSIEQEPEVETQKKAKGNLDKFWLLSNSKNNASRIDSSAKLLKYSSSNPNETGYLLKRLVRGLASPLESTRQSFFVCLVEFLRQQSLEYSEVRKEVEEDLKMTGSKGEESLLLLGQILADLALLRSGKIQSKEDQLDVVRNLSDRGSQRSYLNLVVLNIIVEHFVNDKSELTPNELLEEVGKSFKLNFDEATLDTLFFMLAFLNSGEIEASKDLLSSVFGVKDFKKKNALEKIEKILLGTTQPISAVVCHPVMEALASFAAEKKFARKLFSFFVPEMTKSTYKGQIAVKLLREIINHDAGCTDDLLSVEVLEALKELCIRGVVGPVLDVIELLENQLKEKELSSLSILSRIIDCCVSWDKYVPGNFVSFLISECDEEAAIKVGELLEQKLLSDAKISERVYAAGLLAKIVGHVKVIENIDWRVGKLSTLLETTVISVPGSQTNALTKEAKFQLKDVFYRGLDSNCKSLADNISMVYRLMTHAVHLIEAKSGVPLKPTTGPAKEAWNNVVVSVKKLGKSWTENQNKETGVFLLFFSHIGLQLFTQPEMAVDVLSELQPVYANWNKSKPSKGEPAGIEVVVEIMLSLLAQNKHLLRKVVNCIFKEISDQLTAPALQSLLDVIAVEDADEEEGESSGEEGSDEDDDDDDAENDAEEGEEDSEDEDDEEEDEDTELGADSLAKFKSALGDHAAASEGEASDVDMDDIPEEEMKKLDEKLVQAFKALGGRKSASEKKKEKMDHLAKQHFKLRVLDLLDIYVHHRPSAEFIFVIISSLLESFKTLFANPKEGVLCDRLKAILKKCSNFKMDAPKGFDASEVLEYLLDFGISPSSAVINLGNVHARLCLTALRVNLPEGAVKAEQLYLNALQQFFNNHQCMLSPEVFQLAVGVPWAGAISIAKVVAEKSFDDTVRHFRRSQALAVLSTFIKNQQLNTILAKQKKTVLNDILNNILTNLNTSLDKAKPKQLVEVFAILKGLKQQSVMTEEQVDVVKTGLKAFGESKAMAKQTPAVKKTLKKLLSFFNMKISIGSMDKLKSEGEDLPSDVSGAVETKKKKKKKKSKNAEKRRKEEKEKSSEEDPSSVPSFASMLVDTTQVFVGNKKNKNKRKDSEGKPGPEKKKKKKISS